MRLFLDGPVQKRPGKGSVGYVASCVLSHDDDQEEPVTVEFDYMGAAAPQGNPDRPNPGPGHEASIELTGVIRADGSEIDPMQCEFDQEEFMTAASESQQRFESVAWLRRMAGIE